MTPTEKARNASDAEILAALTTYWQFTFEIVATIAGKQIKTLVPNYRSRLKRLVKEGKAAQYQPFFLLGQERWKLP